MHIYQPLAQWQQTIMLWNMRWKMLAPTRLAFIPKAPTSISLPKSQGSLCPLCLQCSLHLKNKSSGPGCSEDGCSYLGGAPGTGLPQAKGAGDEWRKSWRSSLDMVLLLPFPKGNLNWNMDEHNQGLFSPFCCATLASLLVASTSSPWHICFLMPPIIYCIWLCRESKHWVLSFLLLLILFSFCFCFCFYISPFCFHCGLVPPLLSSMGFGCPCWRPGLT